MTHEKSSLNAKKPRPHSPGALHFQSAENPESNKICLFA